MESSTPSAPVNELEEEIKQSAAKPNLYNTKDVMKQDVQKD